MLQSAHEVFVLKYIQVLFYAKLPAEIASEITLEIFFFEIIQITREHSFRDLFSGCPEVLPIIVSISEEVAGETSGKFLEECLE